jgi:hypothetical protein
MRKRHRETTTGLERVPERATNRLVRSIRDGRIVLSLEKLLPSHPAEEVVREDDRAGGVDDDECDCGGGGSDEVLAGLLVDARCNLRSAEKARDEANGAVEAAEAENRRQSERLAELERRGDTDFSGFANALQLDDLRTALHLWEASSCKDRALELHLDNFDVPFLLNAIAAIGLDSEGAVVHLRGAYLMVVLQWSDVPLSGLGLPRSVEGQRVAHDEAGNLVILEPTTLDVSLPQGACVVAKPETRADAKIRLRAGKAVVAYFGSGGLILGQFAQFWHMVTPMDPRDVMAFIIRVACILYPTSSSVVAGAMTRNPDMCTWERAAELAVAAMGEEGAEEEERKRRRRAEEVDEGR